MDRYLDRFYRELLRDWKGSLVKVASVRHRNAKEYLNRLSGTGKIERISWGWYFIPDRVDSVFDFLRKDRNFKILTAQSAASFWNGDFIHRNVYSLAVKDESYAKALTAFSGKRGWNLIVEVDKDAEKIPFRRIRGLNVEEPAEASAECIQKWAFADAFSIIFDNRKIKPELRRFFWKRISGTNVRVGQVISYMSATKKKSALPDILKRQLNESLERVRELG